MSRVLAFLLISVITIIFAAPVKAEDTVVSVSVKGNRVIESDAVKAAVKIKEGVPFSAADVRSAIKAVFDMGYFTDIQVEMNPVDGGKELVFVVTELPQIKEVKFEGNSEVEEEKLRELLTFKTYTILDRNRVKESIAKIKAEYDDKGYYVADVRYRVEDTEDNQVRLVFEINENEQVMVKKITFLGNRAYSEKELKKILITTEGSWSSWITSRGTFKEDMAAADLELLTSHYMNNGYAQVKIEGPLLYLTHDKKWIYITYRIEEGLKYNFGRIDFKGDILDSVEELNKTVKVKEKDIYSRDKLRQDITKLTDHYGDRGYAFANVVPLTTYDHEKQLIHISFDIRKGELVYFERITIIGNTKTRDKVIRRALKVTEEELYHSTNLKKSRQKVNNIGNFEEVNFSTSRGSESNRLNLTVEVKERPTGTLSIGAGYSSTDKFVGMVQLSQGNLFGKGQKIQLATEYGASKKTYTLGFTDPRVFDSEISAGFDLYNLDKEYTDFSKRSNGAAIRLGFPLEKFEDTRFYLTYRNEIAKIYDISDEAGIYITEQAGTSITSSITLGLEWNTLNNYMSPTEGAKVSGSVEFAGTFLGGTRSFVKYLFNTSKYFPVFTGSTIMLNGGIGYVQELEGEDVPIDERFFLGGMNSVRGFESRSIGPVDENGNVIGGDKKVVVNVEYIFPMVTEAGLKGVLFFDAGEAFGEDEDYSDGDLRTGAGFGIRWYSPIGPLRLEWGFNIDPEPGEKSSRWEFSIGTFFQ